MQGITESFSDTSVLKPYLREPTVEEARRLATNDGRGTIAAQHADSSSRRIAKCGATRAQSTPSAVATPSSGLRHETADDEQDEPLPGTRRKRSSATAADEEPHIAHEALDFSFAMKLLKMK